MQRIIIDKSVLLSDQTSLFCFEDKEIVIPLVVWEALNMKNNDDNDDVKVKIQRLLWELSQEKALSEGVFLNELPKDSVFYSKGQENTCKVRLELQKGRGFERKRTSRNNGYDCSYYDEIIASAKRNEATLITMDTALFTLAKNHVDTKEFEAQEIRDRFHYKGYRFESVPSDFIDNFYKSRDIEDTFDLFPNEFIIFTDHGYVDRMVVGIGKTIKGKKMIRLCDLDPLNKKIYMVTPANLEQKMLLYLLEDPEIKCVSVTGLSGRGKTLLATDFALREVLRNKKYDKFMYTKSIIPTDKSEYMGFYKGDMNDKFLAHLQPLLTCLEYIFQSELKTKKMSVENKFENLKEDNLIITIPLAEIRGMNIFNKMVFLDEAQNIKKHVMKSFITRLTDSSKVIVAGDIEQIDNLMLNKYNNGLSHLISTGKDEQCIAHICLDIDKKDSKRGALATFGALKL